jgi:osmotically-inducible protein OsmY
VSAGSPKGRFVGALAQILLALATASAISGCVPVVVAGAAGGAALVATDRRTAGAQVDDEGIELKVVTQAENLYGDRAHVNVTSYNGLVLLTGEVPDQGAWASLGAFAKAQAKVKSVQNELVVAPPTNLSQRSNDTYITSKVKARMVEANKFPPNAVKVVTERGVVYLMGIVNRTEGASAGDIAATTDGVGKVVKVFEYI